MFSFIASNKKIVPIAEIQNKTLSNLHLEVQKNAKLQREAFKAGVNYIDIETSSQCNRVCNYCTNSINDRLSNNSFISSEIFDSVIDQLAMIDYSHALHFVGYNEPLMHREHIINCISLARKKLPNAQLAIFTNGDYLDYDYFKEIESTGLDSLVISIHLAPGKIYNEGDMLERVLQLSNKLQMNPILRSAIRRESISFELSGSKMEVTMSQRNYNSVGHNRGGLLETTGSNIDSRTSACTLPFNQFIIGHTGKVMPCCVLVHDDINHKNSIVGDLTNANIFEIYTNNLFTDWRKGLLNLRPKSGPCKSCTGALDWPIHNDVDLYKKIEPYIN